MVVKHVSTEELQAIPSAADDLFIIGGKDALVKKQQVRSDDISIYCVMILCVFSFIFVCKAGNGKVFSIK